MAQIIKHRRGSLESLSAVTSSLQKGEIVIASGSSNLTVTNGSSLVFAVPENGQVQATNRFLIGDSAPNTFAASTYNGIVKGVPYYASGSSTLYLLGSGGNDAINLVGNIQPFSASVATSINALSASIGGGSIGNSVTLLNSFTSSQETKNSTLETYTSSVETRFTEIGVISGSLITSASAAKSTNDTQDVRLTNLESKSSSVDTSISELNVSTTALNTYTASADEKFTQIGVVSGSLIASASSAATAIADLEAVGLTYATTGSNIFQGNQVITGSMYITNDLVVYGSSSLFNVTASALDIGQNTIVLNTATPAVRFGGISVADSGSNEGASGSLFWDSLNNHWLYQHPSGAGEGYNSAVLISGPKNSGSLGDETTLTAGKITLAVGEDHIGDSIITQNGTTSISVGGDVIVTGSVTATSFVGSIEATNGVVSGSSQIDVTDTTNFASFSGSVSASIAEVVSNVGSGVGTSITNLNSFTSSQLTQNSDLGTYTGSVETRLNDLASFTGSYATTGSNVFKGEQIISSSLIVTNEIKGTGSIFLQPDVTDSRKLEIYNTAPSDVHIKSTGGLTFLGDDTNYVKIDDSLQIIDITAVNGVFVTGIEETIGEFSQSVDTRFSASVASVTSLSASVASVTGDFSSSVATSFSASNASITSLSASVASVTGDFSSSVATSFSASNATLISLSTSVDSRLDTLEGTGTIQGVGQGNEVTFAKVTTTGDVIVGGDLVVQGNTVTLNTAQLVVEDKLITLASGSTSNATADGAGFEVAGTSASFKYDGTANQFSSSVEVVANVTGSINIPGAGSSKRLAFRSAVGNIEFVAAPSNVGDIAQWDGTDFVMSNVIDGGSF